jgi:5'-3' exonuclease
MQKLFGLKTPVEIVPNDQADTYLIIDVANLAWRAHSVYALTTSKGEPSGHIHGSISLLLSTLKNIVQYGKTCIVFAYEGPESIEKRVAIQPSYKSNRDRTKFSPVRQVSSVLQHVPGLHICVQNAEADDAIAWFTLTKTQGKKVVILSNDGDLWALKSPSVSIYAHSKKAFITDEDVLDKYGVIDVKKIYISKSLYGGDTSDCISGILRLLKKQVNPILNAMAEPTLDCFFQTIEGPLGEKHLSSNMLKKLRDPDNKALAYSNFQIVRPWLELFESYSPPEVLATELVKEKLEEAILQYECRAVIDNLGTFFGR